MLTIDGWREKVARDNGITPEQLTPKKPTKPRRKRGQKRNDGKTAKT